MLVSLSICLLLFVMSHGELSANYLLARRPVD